MQLKEVTLKGVLGNTTLIKDKLFKIIKITRKMMLQYPKETEKVATERKVLSLVFLELIYLICYLMNNKIGWTT